MNAESLQTSFWVMVIIQTLGSVDMPGRGPRKMPAPRQYVAIFITWLVLQLVAGINASAERAAATLGWLLVLVGMVAGPFGSQIVNFFGVVSRQYGTQPSSPTPTATTPNRRGVTV